MNTVLERDRAVVLHNISWNSYKQIADALQDQTPAHLTYDRGTLEIKVLSFQHENLKRLVGKIFERLAEDLGIDFRPAGSTTFQKEAVELAFEPDESYYVKNAEYMRGREMVNLDFDPPPDITIEIDVASSSLNRMAIFGAIGINEVWRYSGSEIKMFILRGDSYRIVEKSQVLPGVAGDAITELLKVGLFSTWSEFIERIDEYAQTLAN